ncbi:hypothetical protein [uncultured Maritimibacter sp.]|jgi:Flp pilus assembly CpaE family ATPase|uniref:AAA family ATPase n=1 Tax=uncultured Maritimibacter sp. TaxID=991866 RepID=UPI002628775D|nr:hypothetical protein [uncultured Maritimibacter sp.]
MNDMSFTSRRNPVTAADPVNMPQAALHEIAPMRSRTVVLSGTPGMAEMVARGLRRDENIDASHRVVPLARFAERPGMSLTDIDLIVFEIRVGNDADMAALRYLREMTQDRVQFLGVTGEPISLATAKALMDAGVSDVIPLTNVQPTRDHSADLVAMTAEAERIAQTRALPTQTGQGDQTRDGLILAACGAAGGIGTTSFALSLATLLARPAKPVRRRGAKPAMPRVAVVDLDFQNGVMGAAIDVADNGAYLDFLRTRTVPTAALVRQGMVRHEATGVDVLAAPVTLAPLDAMTAPMVAGLIDELRLAYDFVVLDLPRALVDWVDPILARADRFFILGDPAVHTVRQMRRMIDLYTDDHAGLPVELVISKQKMSRGAGVKEAESFLGRKFDLWLPRDDRAATRARDHGQPIALARPKSPTVRALVPLVESLCAQQAQANRRRA